MQAYVLNLADTKYDMSGPLPSDHQVAAFLDSRGIGVSGVRVQPSGLCIIFSDVDPSPVWTQFSGQAEPDPAYALAQAISNLQRFIQRYQAGTWNPEDLAPVLADVCQVTLASIGLTADD